jgi:hypothetical protein
MQPQPFCPRVVAELLVSGAGSSLILAVYRPHIVFIAKRLDRAHKLTFSPGIRKKEAWFRSLMTFLEGVLLN